MAVTLYSDRSHLAQTIAPGALSRIKDATVDQAIEDASRLADSYFSQRYTLPLLSVGGDVKLRVTDIVVWYLLKGRVTAEPDLKIIRQSYEDAIRWLEQVAAGKVNPDVTDSSSGAAEQPRAPRARVTSATSRGFDSISD